MHSQWLPGVHNITWGAPFQRIKTSAMSMARVTFRPLCAGIEMVMSGLWVMHSGREKPMYLTMYELLKTLAKAQVNTP